MDFITLRRLWDGVLGHCLSDDDRHTYRDAIAEIEEYNNKVCVWPHNEHCFTSVLAVPYYNDCYTQHWECVNEHGRVCVVTADSLDSALEVWLDNSPTVLHEDLNDWAFTDDGELNDGYYYQATAAPNSTGIVDLGHYWAINELR